MEQVILLVSEDDGSDTYYKLLSSPILARIHNKKFGVYYNGLMENNSNVVCDDNSVYMDDEIIKFLLKFYHGRYTSKWKDIAELFYVITDNGRDLICLPYDYNVFLHH